MTEQEQIENKLQLGLQLGLHKDIVGEITRYNNYFLGKLKQTITRSEQGHNRYINSLTVLPIGELASGDETIKIWERDMSGNYIHKQTITESEPGHTELVSALTVLPTGELVSGSMDQTIKIWERDMIGNYIHKQTITQSEHGHTRSVWALTVLPTGELVSGSWDNTIKIWERDMSGSYIHKQTISRFEHGHTSYVYALTVLPTGELVSGSLDNSIKIWEISDDKIDRSGNYIHKQTITASEQGHTRSVSALTVLPTGELVSGSYDKTIKIWERNMRGNYIHKQTITRSEQEHHRNVRALTVLPTGELVSGSYDETIKIWEISDDKIDRSGNYIHKQTITESEQGHTRAVLALTVLPTGELVSCSVDYTIKMWE